MCFVVLGKLHNWNLTKKSYSWNCCESKENPQFATKR